MTPKELMIGGIVAGAALIIIIIQAILNRLALKKAELSKKILDTSVIIDGRISEIARAGFLEGVIIVPRFVLQELQLISDSSDGMKRSKGRRGLDILNDFKKIHGINVVIMDKDYKISNKVDEKLIAMAKDMPGSKIITNDYNLNKIAEIQGIKVLNINDLSNSIKPSFLPGEKISVKIMKEGKEKEQGIAYLNDGTMIVVDGARRMMNKRVDVIVTNVLQTDAGRMIFARTEGSQPQQQRGGQENRGGEGRDNRGGGHSRHSGRHNKHRHGGRDRNFNRNNQSQGQAQPQAQPQQAPQAEQPVQQAPVQEQAPAAPAPEVNTSANTEGQNNNQ
jgi:rRNA-processing protein FCF1